MDQVYRVIGERIRAERRRQGLTLDELESLSGLSGSYIGQIERNVKKSSLRTIARVARALDVPMGRLFGVRYLPSDGGVQRQLAILIRGSSSAEKRILLSTVKHLARDLKKMRRR